MTIRSILVPVGDAAASRGPVVTAFQVAARFGAHVEGLHVRPDPRANPPPIAEGMTDVRIRKMMYGLRARVDKAERDARRCFDDIREEMGVDRVEAPSIEDSATASWLVQTGREPELVCQRGRVFDLVVTSGAARWRATLEAALLDSGGPVLVAPAEPLASLEGTVVVGWDRSSVCARAVALALPFLRAARAVTVMHAQTGVKAGPSGSDLADHLARHGITATVRAIPPGQRRVGEVLLAEMADAGADLLVMGAYAHPRLRELVLGGVTRYVLDHATRPVLMAH